MNARTIRTLLAVGLALPGLSTVRDVAACPACQCGDPSVLLMGSEAPYRGFWRIGATTQYIRMTVGTPGVNAQDESEARLQVHATYAPTPRLFLSVVAPVVRRELKRVSGARISVTAPGDLEFRSRLYLASRDNRGLRRSFGLALGGTAPTARRQFSSSNEALDIDVQPGLGGWTGSAGLWGNLGFGAWGFSGSTTLQAASLGWEEHRSGRSWLNSVSARYRVADPLALRCGVDSRAAARDTYAGVADPTSGGFSSFLAPGLTITTASGLVLDLGAQIPLSQPAAPHHRDDLVGQLSLTFNH